MLLVTDADFDAHANLLLCFVGGRWNQFGKSGYAKGPWRNGRSSGYH
jgi:TetR/AcrR family transcriptional regulator